MKISRNSLFYKFLNMMDDVHELDSCKIVWLTLRNIVLLPLFLFMFVCMVITVLYPIVGTIGVIFFGWTLSLPLLFIGVFFYGMGLWLIAENYSSNYSHPMFESFKAWKNKTCIKVQVE